MPKDLCSTNDAGRSSILERFGFAELTELRRQLEEAVALARAGAPMALPPILVASMEEEGEANGGRTA